ncbi:hypothetical protein [Clostridium baratii]|uniref:gp53-like domain-containing protein n=1 Tax=Clostridium baratii TaxID=1561 RepID=UPI002942D24F|nr:hypothetical protein [Clostridium baratii]
MATKNAVYKVDNGDGSFDELMFKTVEDMIGGQKQRLFYGQGYRVFPGGLILQWGYVGNLSSKKLNTINLPIALQENNYIAVATMCNGNNTDPRIKTVYLKKDNFKIQAYADGLDVCWLVIGHV